MALTYEESQALMNDMTFRGRVKVAALKYSNAIFDEDGKTPAHNTRMKWASQCAGNPDPTANQLTPNVVMDAAVQQDGKDIADQALQGSVEAVVNKLM